MTDLPAGWEWARFSDVAGVASNLVDPAEFGQFPHIAPNHIESVTGKLLQYQTVAEDGVTSPKHLFRPGQVLYSKIRPYLAKVVTVEFSGLCSADMYPIDTVLEPRFLKWWMLTPRFTEEAIGHQGRSLLPKINVEGLSKLPVPVPPLSEQSRVVLALEEHLSRIDAATEIVRSIRAKSSALSMSLLARTFDLDDTRSRGWPIRRLGEVVLVASGSTPRGLREHLGVEGDSGIPFFKVGDMNMGDGRMLLHSRTYLSQTSVTRLGVRVRPAGTVLIPKRGGAIATNKKRIMGRDGAYDLNIMGLVPTGNLEPSYLWWWLQQLDLTSLADGSNVPQINHPDLTELLIPTPIKSIQKEISAAFDDQLRGELDDFLEWVERRALVLRRSLLEDAFAGRLVPQVPNDESASVLLERIRAERTAQPKAKRARRTAKNANLDQESML